MAANLGGREQLNLDARPDLSEHLTRQVLKLIASRKLHPGDRLPSTKELAELFSVATPTMREALRRLQATGVVDIRHGSGIYVRKIEQSPIITNPHYGELNAETILQLLEARLAIEPYLAGRAAELATDDDLASLKALLDQAERYLNGQDAKLHPTNMQFHTRIARVSGNTILAEFFASLVELYSREQLGILALFNARSRDHHDHVEIFQAIEAHDAPLATERMRHHLLAVHDVVEQRLQESESDQHGG
ncbi:MAG TPA: FadR/GntR family transcriptional regulator [Thermomicrobiales bacterium]|nr:FadR/GntR family transcriptional regulator [Thermomicrobiales bacterium]